MSTLPRVQVLLIEDDPDDQVLIANHLRSQGGFEVDLADTMPQAIEKLSGGVYDAVVSDLCIPGSQGLSTVTNLRKRCGNTPIIVLTSLEDEAVENDILAAGAQDYLIKGQLGDQAVGRAIRHSLQRQQSLNEVEALVEELAESKQLLQQQAELLKKKNRRLRRLYKTAQEFVDNVSHDFRTPLTVIKDYVAIIREEMVGTINDEQRGMLDRVAVRADDLNTMVDDLLDVSKLEAGLLGAWRRTVQVQEILERAEPLLRQRAEVKNVDLVVECEPDLPSVYCDAEKVGRIIANLAINAIKFAGDSGRVRLWVEPDFAQGQIVIGVTDNGPGIDPQSLQAIFRRFRQLSSHGKATTKGFGLGLNIAQQLCRLNLGQLNVQSQLGQGSTFSFTIPFSQPHEILRRWLAVERPQAKSMQLIEIRVDDDVDAAAAEDLDYFFNCMLRSDDLLVRESATNWWQIMASSPAKSRKWLKRAEQEFERHNRNRPMGPLPQYTARHCQSWNLRDNHDSILQDLSNLLTQRESPILHRKVTMNATTA